MRRLPVFLLLLIAAHAAGATGEADWWRTFARKAGSYPLVTRHVDAAGRPRFVNALVDEHSPYLLQHAHNPVAWRPWDDEALATARRTNRLIFLSIGYSTCHWCHVMARESFESERIAALLDAGYVSIKVDREEHPDLDEFFLARLELLSSSPGWPMTLILTPEGEVFAGDSYLGEEALAALLTRMASAWAERPQRVRQLAATLAAKFPAVPAAGTRATDTGPQYEEAIAAVRREYDDVHQGFGRAPKFPNAPHLLALLDATTRSGDPADRERFVATLRAIAQGGLNDPVAGGFFRYSLTSDWQTPHFEKMLADQALLARLLAEAWAITGEQVFAAGAARTLAFAAARLRRGDGLYFSAMDAESEGRAGAYYLWREADLAAALSAEDAARVAMNFRAVPQGEGQVLLLPRAGATGADAAAALAALATLRERRPLPYVDRKVITGWNALMVAALARAGALLGDARYTDEARRTIRRLLALHVRGGRIARYGTADGIHGEASLEDGAHLLGALAALYEADGDARWHAEARRLLPLVAGARLGDPARLRLFARDRELPAASAVLLRALQALTQQSNDPRFRRALETLAPVTAAILAADGVAGRAGLAGALHAIGNPLPQRRAFLARGHVRAELVSSWPPSDTMARTFALDLRIDPGWHINSDQPLQDYLIPVHVEAAAGQDLSVRYPAGKRVRLGIERSPLSVYTGRVSIAGRLDAAPGAAPLAAPVKLRLQACTDRFCLPPESVVLRWR